MPENEEYDWKITGEPWLDGVIFGKGIKRTNSSLYVEVNNLPASTSGKILDSFIKIGLQADFKEVPNAVKKDIDLKIEVIAPSPLFKDIPRFRERRLTLSEDTNKIFLKGFFTAISRPAIGIISQHNADGIYLRYHMPLNDILFFLSLLGIEQYEEYFGGIFLDKEIIKDIEPFDELLQEYIYEIEEFEKQGVTRGKAIDEMFTKIEQNIRSYTIEEIFQSVLNKNKFLTEIIHEFFYGRIKKTASLSDLLKYFNANDENSIKILNSIYGDYKYLNGSFLIEDKEIISFEKTPLYSLQECYDRQLQQLFIRSKEYNIFLSYYNYLKKKQIENPDLLITPATITKNTHEGNVDFAKFFIEEITEGFYYPDSDEYRIPLLVEKKDEDWIKTICNTIPDFITIFKYFTLDIKEKELDAGSYQLVKQCKSCGRKLIFSSGKKCSVCSLELCIDCINSYNKDFRDNFSQEITKQYFCESHFKKLKQWSSLQLDIIRMLNNQEKKYQFDKSTLQRLMKEKEEIEKEMEICLSQSKPIDFINGYTTTEKSKISNFKKKNRMGKTFLRRDSLDVLFRKKKNYP